MVSEDNKWTYKNVKKLQQKIDKGKKPTKKELEKLEEYIKTKNEIVKINEEKYSYKQLSKAEALHTQIKKMI